MKRCARLVGLPVVLVAAAAIALVRTWDGNLLEAQRATRLSGFDFEAVRRAAAWDYVFMGAYGLLLVYAFWQIRAPLANESATLEARGAAKRRRAKSARAIALLIAAFLVSLIRGRGDSDRGTPVGGGSSKGDIPGNESGRRRQPLHPSALAGVILVAGAVFADAVENWFVFRAFAGDDGSPQWLDEMRAAGLFKWGLLGAALITLLTLVLLRPWRPLFMVGKPTETPPGKERQWRPPDKCDGIEEPKMRRVGICLSGGGIRSAAFSLGALQQLRKAGKVDEATYLAAVSGGGYLAAGWALSAAKNPHASPEPWTPGSPEERWFRNHSSYLIPDLKGGLAGIFRLLAGLVINVLLVVLVLSAVSRPIGWAIHQAFEEFRGHQQPLVPRDASVGMNVAGFLPLGLIDKGDDEGPVERYAVILSPAPDKDDGCFFDPASKRRDETCFTVREDRRAVIEVQHARIELVRQPKVAVEPVASPAAVQPKVDQQIKLRVIDDGVIPESGLPTTAQIEVEAPPLLKVKAGPAALPYPSQKRWMWDLTWGLTIGGAVAALFVTAFRPRGRFGDVVRTLGRALGGTALAAWLVLVVLPWLVIWLPRTLASVLKSGEGLAGSSVLDYLVPGGGLLVLISTAARQYFKGGAGPADEQKTGPLKKLRGQMKTRTRELKWYELSPAKIFAAIGSVLALVVVFVNALQFAVANGPTGKVMGFVALADDLPWWAFLPDAVELALIALGLTVFALVADAHTWSLFPFYKQRLSSAFLLQRKGGNAAPLPYEKLLPFCELTQPHGPQLIACCAVNLSDYGVVPPGRRAASFTFSSTEIGGPVVGYVDPASFGRLPTSRQRDVTIPSAMAISGAAFSPAMGKTNLGPLGPVLALANLRLGVWLPHPRRARDESKAKREWDWRRLRRPHWVWFMRELTNKYNFNRRYVYVSDGGHWDNLGLVELLRRGCNEIYCISGAGDRAESFGTIGEAIALAREELGVEVTLDPSALRAATKPAEPAPARELRRSGLKDKAAPYAAAAAVKGTFTFDRFPNAGRGVIYYVEADLTSEIPFDVHTFAEAEIDFPDDSTADQVFNHRQFESYRALGAYQASVAVELSMSGPGAGCVGKLKKTAEKVKGALCS